MTSELYPDPSRYRLYGLTVEQAHQLWLRQDGRCALCRRQAQPAALHVDHDHACCPGKQSCGRCNRGLLCPSCNLSLGHLERLASTTPGGLKAVARYLAGRPVAPWWRRLS